MSLHVEAIGSGPPLVLVHGGPGMDHTYFRPWLDRLADSYTIHFFDLRGHGRNSSHDGGLGPDAWIEDIDLAIHGAGGNVTLLGHSFGGFLALEYVLAHPSRVSRLILSNTGPAFDYPELLMANAEARRPDLVPSLIQLLSGPIDSDEAYRKGMEVVLPLYFEREVDTGPLFGDMLFSAEAYNAGAAWMGDFDVRQRLPEIRCPTTVIASDSDWIMPFARTGTVLAEGISGAELVVLEGCGHFPWVEDTEGYLAAVRAIREA